MRQIAVIGNGAWGCTVAALLAKGDCQVTLWGHDAEYLMECAATRENRRYLPGIKLPGALKHEPDIRAAVMEADLVTCAVPTRHLRSVFSQLHGQIGAQVRIVSLTKGIERESLRFPSVILSETLGVASVGALSGPSMAEEVALGLPASVTVAHRELAIARELQQIFSRDFFRVYASQDVVGVELGGAVKNVIAIAAGVCDGLKLGDNAKAALLSRGLAELRRLGQALSATDDSIFGLAGVGDLYTTCASPLGRNRGFGQRIGSGASVHDAIGTMGGHVVEGYDTALSMHRLAAARRIEMPICEVVYRMLYEGLEPREALVRLLARELRTESGMR